jgi:hypothetical protein
MKIEHSMRRCSHIFAVEVSLVLPPLLTTAIDIHHKGQDMETVPTLTLDPMALEHLLVLHRLPVLELVRHSEEERFITVDKMTPTSHKPPVLESWIPLPPLERR